LSSRQFASNHVDEMDNMRDQIHQLMVQSANVPALGVWRLRCQSVLPTKLFPTLPVFTT